MEEIMNMIVSDKICCHYFFMNFKHEYFPNPSYTNETPCIFRHLDMRASKLYKGQYLKSLQTWRNFDFKVDCPKNLF